MQIYDNFHNLKLIPLRNYRYKSACHLRILKLLYLRRINRRLYSIRAASNYYFQYGSSTTFFSGDSITEEKKVLV